MILTAINIDQLPSVCFYKIEETNNEIAGLERQSKMSAMPVFRIDGAEMFISSENLENNGKVRFLTNKQIMNKAASGNMSQEELFFIRMISTSLVIEMSVEELKIL